MLLQEIVETSTAVAKTSARGQKIALLAATLRQMTPEEAPIGVAYLSGQLRQRQIGVGYASIRDLPPPAAGASLTLVEVDAELEAIGRLTGPASQAERRKQLAALFARATEPEQGFLVRLLIGELRQGAQEGIVLDALAKATQIPIGEVRRAVMLSGDLRAVAEAALRDGVAGLSAFKLQVGRPVLPMLAQSATSITAALERTSPAAIEWKLDGARIQVHVLGGDVRIFTRSLDDITARVPELVEMARTLPVQSVVLDGEAIALREDGRPHPFQVSASRFGSRLDVERLRAALPLTPFVFDVLHLDGEDLIDQVSSKRFEALSERVPERWRVPRIVTDDPLVGDEFLRDALERGHEGVVVKSLEAATKLADAVPVGSRSSERSRWIWSSWRPSGATAVDRVGCRTCTSVRATLSSGGFVMLGKTFKGLTDAMLAWQTEHLLSLERERDRWTVYVRPELVVEIAFDGVQRSPRYPGGVALRFARVLRYRTDKQAEDADTLEMVRQFGAVD